MTTAEIVRERALSLAEAGAPTDEAVNELLESSGDRRVAVVLAEQEPIGRAQPGRRAARPGAGADALGLIAT